MTEGDGLPSHGEAERIGIQGEAFQGWTTQRGKRLSPRVKSTRNEEYQKGKVRRGEWQMEAISVIPEMEWNPRPKARVRDHRHGADPPKNESGMTVSVSAYGQSSSFVNSGNDTCIGVKTCSNCHPSMNAQVDFTYTILLPKCRNDVVHVCWGRMAHGHSDKRQCWPDVQHVPCGCSRRTIKLQI